MSQKPPVEKPEMCQLTDKAPAEVLAMTKEAIVAAMFEGVERSVPQPIVYDELGRPMSHETPVTDAYGVLKQTESIRFSYYGNEADSPVDIITVTERDTAGEVMGGHRVKHYTDGRPSELLPLEDGGEVAGMEEGAELVLGGPEG